MHLLLFCWQEGQNVFPLCVFLHLVGGGERITAICVLTVVTRETVMHSIALYSDVCSPMFTYKVEFYSYLH